MGLYNYSIKPGAKDATAQGHDWDASYKDLSNVCRTIKRKSVTQTRKILDEALSKKKAIPYTFHNKGTGHRSELGGKKGRYPQKECRLLRNLLENAVSNAMQKGLDESKLYVKHAAANKLRTHKRYRRFWATSVTLGYGKQAVWANYQTCRAEIIISEREQKTKTSKK
ncbi:MAG: 50S ribosomal protein L22, partial [Candidatus Micrarchaeia archaeon]